MSQIDEGSFSPFSVWLVHPASTACAAFAKRFEGMPKFYTFQKRYEELEPHDCFVTAGNAYGMMTAGIDAAVVRFYGEEIMDQVKHRVMDDYLGEQPVGTAFIIETGNDAFPFLCHAPTMRVPGSIEGGLCLSRNMGSVPCCSSPQREDRPEKSKPLSSLRWDVALAAFVTTKLLDKWRPLTGTISNLRTGSTGILWLAGRKRSVMTGPSRSSVNIQPIPGAQDIAMTPTEYSPPLCVC